MNTCHLLMKGKNVLITDGCLRVAFLFKGAICIWVGTW